MGAQQGSQPFCSRSFLLCPFSCLLCSRSCLLCLFSCLLCSFSCLSYSSYLFFSFFPDQNQRAGCVLPAQPRCFPSFKDALP